MQLTFVSGWSGLPCLYPTIASKSRFLIPFLDHSPADISEVLAAGGDLLVGWSTGAHQILKELDLACENFRNILLVAPFLDFSTCVPPRIVRLMKARLLREAERTVEDFWKLCGTDLPCPQLSANQIKALADGLDFLMTSRAEPAGVSGLQVTLVNCRQDQIVTARAFQEVIDSLGMVSKKTCDSPHLVHEPELIRIMSDVSGATLL